MEITTNRDLYLSIAELGKQHKNGPRTLEAYLLALLGLVRGFRERKGLTLSEFYGALSESFTAAPLPFDAAWRDGYATLDPGQDGFPGWEALILSQIVDLREMDEVGTIKNEYRYFGLASPRGSYWYNFDPVPYLECAQAGSLGGWEPEDETGRQFVPGETAVMGVDGQIQSVDPQSVERPVFDIPSVSWDMFKDFLECGQMYE